MISKKTIKTLPINWFFWKLDISTEKGFNLMLMMKMKTIMELNCLVSKEEPNLILKIWSSYFQIKTKIITKLFLLTESMFSDCGLHTFIKSSLKKRKRKMKSQNKIRTQFWLSSSFKTFSLNLDRGFKFKMNAVMILEES